MLNQDENAPAVKHWLALPRSADYPVRDMSVDFSSGSRVINRMIALRCPQFELDGQKVAGRPFLYPMLVWTPEKLDRLGAPGRTIVS